MATILQFPIERIRSNVSRIQLGDIVSFKNGKTTIMGKVIKVNKTAYLIGDLNVWNVPKELVKKV
jgi:uncharacterized protein YkvS